MTLAARRGVRVARTTAPMSSTTPARWSSVTTSASALGTPRGTTGDLAHYSSGDHVSVWDIDGARCGALICYDYRFPELYCQYKRLGVDLVFHSFHASNMSPQKLAEVGAGIGPELRKLNPAPTHTYPSITMPASVTAAAAANHLG